MSKEIMQQALDALKNYHNFDDDRLAVAMDILHQALAQPEQELDYPPECETPEMELAYAAGWWKALEVQRNKQQALDKKAENARELGLDYEPDVTFIDEGDITGNSFDRTGSHMTEEYADTSGQCTHKSDKFIHEMQRLGQELEQEPFNRLIRIMGTFDLATGHADNWDDLLESLESELRDVLGHYREALKQEPDVSLTSEGKTGQEPVAWLYNGHLHECDPSDWAEEEVTPLYATPPKREWQGLTNDEIDDIRQRNVGFTEQARLIESKIRGKNG